MKYWEINENDLQLFAIDDGAKFVGVNMNRWNGWACPLFFVDQLPDILSAYCGIDDGETPEEIQDRFADVFGFHFVTFNGCPRLMVDVGSHNWCWDDVECEDHHEIRWLCARVDWLRASDSIAYVAGGLYS